MTGEEMGYIILAVSIFGLILTWVDAPTGSGVETCDQPDEHDYNDGEAPAWLVSKYAIRGTNMKAFVIFMNGCPVHTVLNDELLAETIKEEKAKSYWESQKRNLHDDTYEDFRKRVYWHYHETTVTNRRY